MPSQPYSAGSELPTVISVQLRNCPSVVSLTPLSRRGEWMKHNTNALGVLLRNRSKLEENKQGASGSSQLMKPAQALMLCPSR